MACYLIRLGVRVRACANVALGKCNATIGEDGVYIVNAIVSQRQTRSMDSLNVRHVINDLNIILLIMVI